VKAQQAVIDYKESFPDALLAQGCGRQFLLLHRVEGEESSSEYELIRKHLAIVCSDSQDRAYKTVLHEERTIWKEKEIRASLTAVLNKQSDISSAIKNGVLSVYVQVRKFRHILSKVRCTSFGSMIKPMCL